MLEELEDGDWACAFGEDCITLSYYPTITCKGISTKDITRDAVKRIVAMDPGENEGPAWVGVFELNDGRFVAISSSCDYTGWDCQAGGQCFVSSSLKDLVRFGLSNDERERLKLEVEA